MNTDLLTFFQPEESSGTAATFSVDVDKEIAIEVWMFSREKIDLSRFARTAVSSEEDWKNFHQELQASLQPGGGFLVYAQAHNDGVKAQIFRKEAPGYQPPNRMLRLTLCGDAQFEEIKNNVDLRVGDHLVLPVNGQAEGRLTALRDDLKGLPSDLESSVLNIIRRPSLEWRLDRIERTLSLPQATQADQRKCQARQSSFMERLYDFVMWKVPIGPVVGALLLMAGTLLAYDKFFHAASATEAPVKESKVPQVNPTPHPSPPSPPPPVKPAPKDLKASLDALFKSLETSGDPHIHGLYTTHFKGHREDALKVQNVSWGITKLQTMELGFLEKKSPVVNDVSAWTNTEKIYRDNNENFDTLKRDQNAVDLLAYTWCQQSGAPSLP